MKIERDPHGEWLYADDRRWPCQSFYERFEMGNALLRRTAMISEGCRVRFESGYDVSVIWGMCTYSDNYDAQGDDDYVSGPVLVEAAVLQGDHIIGDEPLGYLTASALIALMDLVERTPKDNAEQLTELIEALVR